MSAKLERRGLAFRREQGQRVRVGETTISPSFRQATASPAAAKARRLPDRRA